MDKDFEDKAKVHPYAKVEHSAMKLLPSKEMMFVLIVGRSHKKNKIEYCDTSVTGFAKFFGVTEDKIKRWKRELKEAGLIRVENVAENGKHKASLIYPIYPDATSVENDTGVKNDTGTGVKNDTGTGVKNDTGTGVKNDTQDNSIDNNIDNIYRERPFDIPDINAIATYAQERGFDSDSALSIAKRFFDYYDAADWHDARGRKVKSWKQRLLSWIANEKSRQPQPQPKQPVYYTGDDDLEEDYSKY